SSRCISSNGAQSLVTSLPHGSEDGVDILRRVAENSLSFFKVFGTIWNAQGLRCRHQAELEAFLADPFIIRLSITDSCFDLLIKHDFAFFQICQQHPARADPAFFSNHRLADGQGTGLL